MIRVHFSQKWARNTQVVLKDEERRKTTNLETIPTLFGQYPPQIGQNKVYIYTTFCSRVHILLTIYIFGKLGARVSRKEHAY